LVCRTEHKISDDIKSKLALFCNVDHKSVIEAKDADTIYDVPLLMLKEKLDTRVLKKLKLKYSSKPELLAWKDFLGRHKNPTHEIKIGLIGKYNELPDAYKSIYEAFVHSGASNECKVIVEPIHSERLESDDIEKYLSSLDGVLVAPGFGERGVEGKIRAIKYVRKNNIPFFGICLGMQCAVVEFARNVMKLKKAASIEVKPNTPEPVINMMEDQKNIKNMGGTMRLGSQKCKISKGTIAYKAYGRSEINERHRHRYEFNSAYKSQFEDAGMRFTGINPKSELVEIIELTDHPYFIGVQFHPELKRTVEKPHPLFVAFVKATLKNKLENEKA